MKLYLDDVRPPPDNTWTVAKTVKQAQQILSYHRVEEASLDHDLGICPICTPGQVVSNIVIMKSLDAACPKGCICDCHETGYDLVKWMAANSIWTKTKPKVHSANPMGAMNMKAMIERYWK